MASDTTSNPRINVIVSGISFELDSHIQDLISTNFPDSPLGVMLRYRDKLTITEPFEGPLPGVFQAILQFLQEKEWVVPNGMSPWLFLQEADFWMIPCDIESLEYEDPQISFALSTEFGRILAEESSKRSEMEADLQREMKVAESQLLLSILKTSLAETSSPLNSDDSVVSQSDSVGYEDLPETPSPRNIELDRLATEEVAGRSKVEADLIQSIAELSRLAIFEAYFMDIPWKVLAHRETPHDAFVFQSLIVDVLMPFFEKRLMAATIHGHGMLCISFDGSFNESVYSLSDETGVNLVHGLVPFLDEYRSYFMNLRPLPLVAISRKADVLRFVFEWDEHITALKKSASVYAETVSDVRVRNNEFIINDRYRFAIENETLFKKVLRCN